MAERWALVAEDHADIRELVAEVLTEAGFRVFAARDGLEAFDQLARLPRPPNVIVLDLMMPVMDGAQLAQQVRLLPAFSEVPIVAVTALRISGAACPSVDAFVRKPFDPEELVHTVERAICAREVAQHV